MPSTGKKTHFEIDQNDCVQVVEFCPFELCGHLILIGTTSRIQVGSLKFQENDNQDEEEMHYNILQEIHHGNQVTAAAWSPETSIYSVPKMLRFVTGSSDYEVLLFTTDAKTDVESLPLIGHTGFVNAVCFEPDTGEKVASTSDDMSCRIWDLDGVVQLVLPLQSPGVAVEWPKSDPNMLMVAERNGRVRFYNVVLGQAIMSLDCFVSPLNSANMSCNNPAMITVACSNQVFLFNTRETSLSTSSWESHGEACLSAKWCHSHENIVACLGQTKNCFKVFNTKLKADGVLAEREFEYASGFSWHSKLPVVAIGSDRKVHVWMLDL